MRKGGKVAGIREAKIRRRSLKYTTDGETAGALAMHFTQREEAEKDAEGSMRVRPATGQIARGTWMAQRLKQGGVFTVLDLLRTMMSARSPSAP